MRRPGRLPPARPRRFLPERDLHGRVWGFDVATGAACDDLNACTTGTTCGAKGICAGGTAVTCPPGDTPCDTATGCSCATAGTFPCGGQPSFTCACTTVADDGSRA